MFGIFYLQVSIWHFPCIVPVLMNDKIKDVFLVSDKQHGDRAHILRIGVAFVNKDNSLSVVLDAIPLTGRLYIRDRRLKKVAA